jgi:hypothetical protein
VRADVLLFVRLENRTECRVTNLLWVSIKSRTTTMGEDLKACLPWARLRAVLTNSPNSCPSERLFTIFNSTFDSDQKSSYVQTTYSYRYSLSLTIEYSSSRVSRSEGEGEEWVRGFGRLLASAIIHYHVHAGNLVVSDIRQTKNRLLLSIIVFCSQ